MRYIIMAAIISSLLAACDRRKCGCNPPAFDGSACTLKATVVQTANLDCNKPLLVFEDTAALRHITGLPNTVSSDLFIADVLPPSLNVLNKQLWVCAGKLTSQEEFACTLMGPSYPHVKVIYAKERN